MTENLHGRLHHNRDYARRIVSELEASKNLLTIGRRCGAIDFEDCETLGLGGGAVLSNRNLIAVAETEAWGGVCGDVTMTLFESLVLADPMEVIPADDDGLLHLCGHDDAAKQTAADGHVSGEGTLLVDVGAVDGFARGLDAETNVAEPAVVLAADAAYQGDGALLGEGLVVDDLRHGCRVMCRVRR